MTRVDVPDEVVDREAVGEVLAPAGTEVVPGVEGTQTRSEDAAPEGATS